MLKVKREHIREKSSFREYFNQERRKKLIDLALQSFFNSESKDSKKQYAFMKFLLKIEVFGTQ